MGKTLRNAISAAFMSFLFVGVSLTSAGAQENCPSNVETMGTFQEMSSDFTARGYQPTIVIPIISLGLRCGAIFLKASSGVMG